MHTPIHQIRQDLLQKRSAFVQSTAFNQEYGLFLSQLRQFLLRDAGAYRSIAFCWPYRDELDLRQPLLEWQEGKTGRQLLLPKINIDRSLQFYTWSNFDPMVLNAYGIPEPDPKAKGVELKIPDCILIPCVGWLAYQHQYWRLGYGGGYFDRTIAALKHSKQEFTTIGIAFDWQELSEQQWVPQMHDEPLDYVLTNSGVQSKTT